VSCRWDARALRPRLVDVALTLLFGRLGQKKKEKKEDSDSD
jgi:hypothetical protein